MCSLMLAGCDKQPPIECWTPSCSANDGSCKLGIWVWAGKSFTKALPMGRDALVYEGSEKVDQTGLFPGDYRWVDRYSYSYAPVEAPDGVFSYFLKIPGNGGKFQCAGKERVKGAKGLLVALQVPALVLDNESGPVPLPDYVVGGTLSSLAEASWSANEPDWVIIEEEGEQYLRYAGTAGEASSPRAATLTVSATGSDGTQETASVALAARYVHSTLELNQEYALPGDEIIATYQSGLDDEETDDNGATWELRLTPEEGQTVDKSADLLTTASPDERRFVAEEIGRYTVKRIRAGVDGEQGSANALSGTVTVLEPAVNVAFSPLPEDIDFGEPVLFDASGSTMPPGAEVFWVVTERPEGSSAEMVPDDIIGKRATLTPDVMEGNYTVEAQLMLPFLADPLISSQSFSFVSTPVAGPVTDETEHWVGDEVSFDLAGSSYPSGSSFKYVLRSAPEGSNAQLVISEDGTQASLVTDVTGSYEVELTITNAEGETSSHVTSISAEVSPVVPLILTSDLPVVDSDGDELAIVIDIDGENHLTAMSAIPEVGTDRALFVFGAVSDWDTADIYDSSGEPFELVDAEDGLVVLEANVGHTLHLKRDNGVYYQLRMTFETGDVQGDATITGLSGYNCGESLSDCP
ncbi:hypothetical protein ACEK07_22120 [Alcanivoracaceae bacterium MT1]